MKKTISILLVLLMLAVSAIGFAGCSKDAEGSKDGNDAEGNGVSVPAKDLKENRFGVQNGTTAYSFLNGDEEWGFAGYPNIELSGYESGALAITDMKNGNLGYVVIDADVAKSLVANNAGTKVIDIPLTVEQYGIGVDKDQPELMEKINKILKDKKSDIDAIFKAYENIDDDTVANWEGDTYPAGEYDPSKEQLVVATNAEFAPFEFVLGENYAGIDMAIAKLIADELGMELVISNMDFDAVTASVGKNGVDIALAGLTINETRKKVVSFSDPYYTDAYQVIICMEDNKTFDECKTTEDVLAIMSKLGK